MTPEELDRINETSLRVALRLGVPLFLVWWVIDPSWLRAAMVLAYAVLVFVVYVLVDGVVEAMLRDQGRRRCETYWQDDEKEEPWAR